MQRTKCLHVCLHIDWNPYGTFKEFLENSEFSIISQTAGYNIVHTAILFHKGFIDNFEEMHFEVLFKSVKFFTFS